MSVSDSVPEGAVAGVARTRETLHKARHLPGHVYTSPEIYRLEKQQIFMRDWLCVGRMEEVGEPGDYMALRIMDEPIVVARDDDGRVNAFGNVCRHRGVEVVSGSGNAREFSCPYHAWLYDLRGRLIGAPYMKEAEDFVPENCRLTPLRFDEWRGWMFVNFDPDAVPLAEFAAEYEREFAFLHHEKTRLATKHIVDLDCNWKLFVENLQDFYHVQVLHRDTFGGHIDIDEFVFNVKEKGGFSSFYDAAPDTPDSVSLVGKMPWLADKPMSFAYTGFLAPNFHMFGRIDESHPMVIWPLAPDKTRVIVYHVFPAEHFDRPDFAEKARVYHDFLARVVEEDREMVNSLQRGMNSRLFEPGPLSRMEVNLHSLLNYYLDRMEFGA